MWTQLTLVVILLFVAHICGNMAAGCEKAANSPWAYNRKDKQRHLLQLKLLYDYGAWIAMSISALLLLWPLIDLVCWWIAGLPSQPTERQPMNFYGPGYN